MASLCDSFPIDISGALLAYAEANSFTRYLYGQYGSSGLDKLVKGYADGLDCRRGVEVAFGSTLEQLEEQWLEETYGLNALHKAFGTLLPWFALFFLVMLFRWVLLWAVCCIGKGKVCQQTGKARAWRLRRLI